MEEVRLVLCFFTQVSLWVALCGVKPHRGSD
jgi:hypothetical protein